MAKFLITALVGFSLVVTNSGYKTEGGFGFGFGGGEGVLGGTVGVRGHFGLKGTQNTHSQFGLPSVKWVQRGTGSHSDIEYKSRQGLHEVYNGGHSAAKVRNGVHGIINSGTQIALKGIKGLYGNTGLTHIRYHDGQVVGKSSSFSQPRVQGNSWTKGGISSNSKFRPQSNSWKNGGVRSQSPSRVQVSSSLQAGIYNLSPLQEKGKSWEKGDYSIHSQSGAQGGSGVKGSISRQSQSETIVLPSLSNQDQSERHVSAVNIGSQDQTKLQSSQEIQEVSSENRSGPLGSTVILESVNSKGGLKYQISSQNVQLELSNHSQDRFQDIRTGVEDDENINKLEIHENTAETDSVNSQGMSKLHVNEGENSSHDHLKLQNSQKGDKEISNETVLLGSTLVAKGESSKDEMKLQGNQEVQVLKVQSQSEFQGNTEEKEGNNQPKLKLQSSQEIQGKLNLQSNIKLQNSTLVKNLGEIDKQKSASLLGDNTSKDHSNLYESDTDINSQGQENLTGSDKQEISNESQSRLQINEWVADFSSQGKLEAQADTGILESISSQEKNNDQNQSGPLTTEVVIENGGNQGELGVQGGASLLDVISQGQSDLHLSEEEITSHDQLKLQGNHEIQEDVIRKIQSNLQGRADKEVDVSSQTGSGLEDSTATLTKLNSQSQTKLQENTEEEEGSGESELKLQGSQEKQGKLNSQSDVELQNSALVGGLGEFEEQSSASLIVEPNSQNQFDLGASDAEINSEGQSNLSGSEKRERISDNGQSGHQGNALLTENISSKGELEAQVDTGVLGSISNQDQFAAQIGSCLEERIKHQDQSDVHISDKQINNLDQLKLQIDQEAQDKIQERNNSGFVTTEAVIENDGSHDELSMHESACVSDASSQGLHVSEEEITSHDQLKLQGNQEKQGDIQTESQTSLQSGADTKEAVNSQNEPGLKNSKSNADNNTETQLYLSGSDKQVEVSNDSQSGVQGNALLAEDMSSQDELGTQGDAGVLEKISNQGQSAMQIGSWLEEEIKNQEQSDFHVSDEKINSQDQLNYQGIQETQYKTDERNDSGFVTTEIVIENDGSHDKLRGHESASVLDASSRGQSSLHVNEEEITNHDQLKIHSDRVIDGDIQTKSQSSLQGGADIEENVSSQTEFGHSESGLHGSQDTQEKLNWQSDIELENSALVRSLGRFEEQNSANLIGDNNSQDQSNLRASDAENNSENQSNLPGSDKQEEFSKDSQSGLQGKALLVEDMSSQGELEAQGNADVVGNISNQGQSAVLIDSWLEEGMKNQDQSDVHVSDEQSNSHGQLNLQGVQEAQDITDERNDSGFVTTEAVIENDGSHGEFSVHESASVLDASSQDQSDLYVNEEEITSRDQLIIQSDREIQGDIETESQSSLQGGADIEENSSSQTESGLKDGTVTPTQLNSQSQSELQGNTDEEDGSNQSESELYGTQEIQGKLNSQSDIELENSALVRSLGRFEEQSSANIIGDNKIQDQSNLRVSDAENNSENQSNLPGSDKRVEISNDSQSGIQGNALLAEDMSSQGELGTRHNRVIQGDIQTKSQSSPQGGADIEENVSSQTECGHSELEHNGSQNTQEKLNSQSNIELENSALVRSLGRFEEESSANLIGDNNSQDQSNLHASDAKNNSENQSNLPGSDKQVEFSNDSQSGFQGKALLVEDMSSLGELEAQGNADVVGNISNQGQSAVLIDSWLEEVMKNQDQSDVHVSDEQSNSHGQLNLQGVQEAQDITDERNDSGFDTTEAVIENDGSHGEFSVPESASVLDANSQDQSDLYVNIKEITSRDQPIIQSDRKIQGDIKTESQSSLQGGEDIEKNVRSQTECGHSELVLNGSQDTQEKLNSQSDGELENSALVRNVGKLEEQSSANLIGDNNSQDQSNLRASDAENNSENQSNLPGSDKQEEFSKDSQSGLQGKALLVEDMSSQGELEAQRNADVVGNISNQGQSAVLIDSWLEEGMKNQDQSDVHVSDEQSNCHGQLNLQGVQEAQDITDERNDSGFVTTEAVTENDGSHGEFSVPEGASVLDASSQDQSDLYVNEEEITSRDQLIIQSDQEIQGDIETESQSSLQGGADIEENSSSQTESGLKDGTVTPTQLNSQSQSELQGNTDEEDGSSQSGSGLYGTQEIQGKLNSQSDIKLENSALVRSLSRFEDQSSANIIGDNKIQDQYNLRVSDAENNSENQSNLPGSDKRVEISNDSQSGIQGNALLAEDMSSQGELGTQGDGGVLGIINNQGQSAEQIGLWLKEGIKNQDQSVFHVSDEELNNQGQLNLQSIQEAREKMDERNQSRFDTAEAGMEKYGCHGDLSDQKSASELDASIQGQFGPNLSEKEITRQHQLKLQNKWVTQADIKTENQYSLQGSADIEGAVSRQTETGLKDSTVIPTILNSQSQSELQEITQGEEGSGQSELKLQGPNQEIQGKLNSKRIIELVRSALFRIPGEFEEQSSASFLGDNNSHGQSDPRDSDVETNSENQSKLLNLDKQAEIVNNSQPGHQENSLLAADFNSFNLHGKLKLNARSNADVLGSMSRQGQSAVRVSAWVKKDSSNKDNYGHIVHYHRREHVLDNRFEHNH